jgi:uncharacterized protein
MRNKLILCLIFFQLVAVSAYSQWTPYDIPNPKPVDNSYVSDPDGFLDASTIRQLNNEISQIETQSGIEFAIVIVNQISNEWDVFGFAVELFTEWGIGKKDRDSGLLLFLVMDTHDWRFVSGYGVEGLFTDALLWNLGDQYIVPYFRQSDYAGGLIAVTEKIKEIATSEDAQLMAKYYTDYQPWWETWRLWMWALWGLFFISGFISFLRQKKYYAPHKVKLYKVEKNKTHSQIIPDGKQKVHIWAADKTTKFISIYMLSALIPAMSMYYGDFFSNPAKNSFIGLYAFLMLFSLIIQWKINNNAGKISNDNIEKYFTLKNANKSIGFRVFLFPVPFLFYYFMYRHRLKTLKNGSISCPICQTQALPASSDIYEKVLEKPKLFERKIKSIDHRVFQCLNLHTVEVPFPGRRHSAFKECSKCGTLAMRQTRNRTVSSPTYTSTGTGEREYTCKFCAHKSYTTYVIPMRTRSSSSGGSSSGGSSSGGGGSWGGGSTGGGGAGGRW